MYLHQQLPPSATMVSLSFRQLLAPLQLHLTLSQAGQISAAIVELKGAVALDPTLGATHSLLGVALDKLGTHPSPAVPSHLTGLAQDNQRRQRRAMRVQSRCRPISHSRGQIWEPGALLLQPPTPSTSGTSGHCARVTGSSLSAIQRRHWHWNRRCTRSARTDAGVSDFTIWFTGSRQPRSGARV